MLSLVFMFILVRGTDVGSYYCYKAIVVASKTMNLQRQFLSYTDIWN